MSKSGSAFKGALVAQIFTIISMVLAIFSTPYMVKYLSKEEYGLSILFFQILGYLSLLDFGLSTAVIRNISLLTDEDKDNYRQTSKIISTSFFFSVGLGLIIFVSIYAFSGFIPGLFDIKNEFHSASIAVIISLGFTVLTTFMQRGIGGMFFANHRQALITTPSLIMSTISVILTVVLLKFGFRLWAFVYVNILTAVVNLTIVYWMSKRYYPSLSISVSSFDIKLLKSMYNFGFFMFVIGIANQIILSTDRIVIGKLLSIEAIAVFSITVRIPEICLTLLSHLTFHASPALNDIVNKRGQEEINKAYLKLNTLIISLCMIAFWLIIIMNKWFIALWVGLDFFSGYTILALALVIMLQQALIRTGVFFLNAKGIARSISFVTLAEAVINLTLSIALGRLIGIPGILAGTIIASMLTSGLFIPFLMKKHFRLSYFKYWIKSFIQPILLVSAIGGAMYFITKLLIPEKFAENWFGLLAIGFVETFVILLFSWFLILKNILSEYIPIKYKSLFYRMKLIS